MDFEYHYSDEQQRFRDEVRSWLDANVPPGHEMPVDPEDLDEETYRFFRSVHQELGARGWLYPTYPREYGGGGLTPEHEMIPPGGAGPAQDPGRLRAADSSATTWSCLPSWYGARRSRRSGFSPASSPARR